MPPATRLGDDCTGHGCWPPRPNNQASPNIIINNIPAHRQTDGWAVHCCGPACHGGSTVSGSPTVINNNLQSARIGDPVSCGSSIAVGSPNVIVGDYPSLPPASQMMNQSPFLVMKNTAESQAKADAANAPNPDVPNQSELKPITGYDHATVESDDEGAPTDPEVGSSYGGGDRGGSGGLGGSGKVDYTSKQQKVASTAKSESVDITTPPTTKDETTVTPQAPLPASGYNYDDIDSATSFSSSFQLSPNFTLGMLTTNARVSKYALKAQFTSGKERSEKEIVKNLRDLCYNILEPMKSTYGSIIINSGFRHGNGKSQHEIGQGVDVAFPGMDTNASSAYERAKEIANSSLPYDQFIFEQNNTIWFHLSYNKARSSQRRMVMTKPKGVDSPSAGLRMV